MIIGIPKEIKANEYRVAATPAGVKTLIERGHQLVVGESVGVGSGFSDDDYKTAGAKITSADDLYSTADMIYKVKEILEPEFKYMREDLIIFTYLHSNANLEMTEVLLKNKVIAISYEDLEDENGQFPLLKPMSDIAGRGGFLAALQFTQSINGGNGVLLSRVPGVKTPVITIIGAGAAGIGAAELASAFGNKVVILDLDLNRLEEAKYKLPPNVELLYSNRSNLEKCLVDSDVIINCLLWPKTREDHLIFKEDLSLMKPGSIISDVSCDEGGAIETCRATSHHDPIYSVDGIIHYAVDNIPSAFSQTSTTALSNATLPYAIKIAGSGAEQALANDRCLRKGLSFYRGKLTLKETALKHNLDYDSPESVLNL